MQSLRGRAGRLQAFSRSPTGAADGTDATTQRAQEAGEGQDLNQMAVPTLDRQELAELARLPIPKAIRQSLGHQRGSSQPHLDSRHGNPPPLAAMSHLNGFHHMNGVNGNGFRNDLFTGSQLGESFMNSGITTPHNEPAEPEPEPESEPEPEPERVPPPERKNNIVPLRGPSRSNLDQGVRSGGNATFQVSDNLLLKVVAGPRRFHPSHMNDGFVNSATDKQKQQENRQYKADYNRPASPAERQPKAPLREVRIRHPQPTRHNDFISRHSRPASPIFDTNSWQRRHPGEVARHTRFQEPDDDGASTVHGGIPGTPRARRGDISPLNHDDLAVAIKPISSQPPRDNKKRRRGSLDYDDMALNNMSYTELQKEPFEYDPAKATPHAGGHGAGGGNLSAKLEQYRDQTDKEQLYLFRNLSMDDWETAGEWFADQFAEIMRKLRDARRDKRRLVQGFEDEAAGREEAVRLRSEAIDRKLAKMRQDGQRVVATNEM